MGNFLKKIDIKGLEYISVRYKNKVFDKIMPKITRFGDLGIIWLCLSLLLMFKVNSRVIGIQVIIALIITSIIGEGIIKNIVKRKRPFEEKDSDILINKPISYSFPSGHTASSFAALTVFMQKYSAFNWVVIPMATLIAFSRIYLKVHYPTDVLCGIILGCLCGFSVLAF